jgi:hypothetical protein
MFILLKKYFLIATTLSAPKICTLSVPNLNSLKVQGFGSSYSASTDEAENGYKGMFYFQIIT